MAEPLSSSEDFVDPKSFHELLYDHQSQDFKKARRNLMVISFIIISVWFLGLEWKNLSVFGLDLKDTSNGEKIRWIGVGLAVYWWGMFEFYRCRDKNIQTLRHDMVHEKVANMRNDLPALKEKLEKWGDPKDPGDKRLKDELSHKIKDYEKNLGNYDAVQAKNEPVLLLVLRVEKIELWVPRIFAILALAILFFG